MLCILDLNGTQNQPPCFRPFYICLILSCWAERYEYMQNITFNYMFQQYYGIDFFSWNVSRKHGKWSHECLMTLCLQSYASNLFLSQLFNFLHFSCDIFISTRRTTLIFLLTYSPESGEYFSYPQHVSKLISHHSTAIWSKIFRRKKSKSDFREDPKSISGAVFKPTFQLLYFCFKWS